MRPQRIVSGGQSGVDRAALDAALALRIPCGGWCPRGRLAEDGTLPLRYPLLETPTARYPQRTEWNVRDSDATLILTHGSPTGGTALTVEIAMRYRKPVHIVDLDQATEGDAVRVWLEEVTPTTLNIAGPRESHHPGIYRQSLDFLTRLLAQNEGC